MLNTKQLKIGISIFIAFILTSCAHFTHYNKLPIDVAKKVHEVIGEDFDFPYLAVMDAETGKSMFLKRTEILKDGKPQYETKRIFGPVPVMSVKKVTSHSVIVAELIEKNGPEDPPHCNNIGHSICNIVKIDNEEPLLICKKTGSLFQKASTTINEAIKVASEIPGELIDSSKGSDNKIPELFTEIITLPKELVKELKILGGGTVNNIAFLILNDLKTGKTKLLLQSDEYKKVDFEKMRDCVGKLNTINSTSAIFYKGSCCSATSSNGNEKKTCNRLC